MGLAPTADRIGKGTGETLAHMIVIMIADLRNAAVLPLPEQLGQAVQQAFSIGLAERLFQIIGKRYADFLLFIAAPQRLLPGKL